jgi:outer membrane protein OmpA-like peptidoglycan-associated protein
MRSPKTLVAAAFVTLALAMPGAALRADEAAESKAPDKLVVYFDAGSYRLRAEDVATLDHASRLYHVGKPIVMIVSGSTDPVGSPEVNLSLSQRRAMTVLRGLVARGIPAERFQVVSKGETYLPVAAPPGTPEPQDRRVEISWR